MFATHSEGLVSYPDMANAQYFYQVMRGALGQIWRSLFPWIEYEKRKGQHTYTSTRLASSI